MSRLVRAMAGTVLLLAVPGCAPARSDAGPGASPPVVAIATGSAAQGNPLTGVAFYVDPDSHAGRQVVQWQQQGRAADATLLRRIADRPAAHWVVGGADVRATAAELTARAGRAGQVAVLAVYNIPGRDCGQFSAGGATSSEAYRQWIASLADGIGDRPAVVILEPDAVAQSVDCLNPQQATERFALLAGAVQTLRAHPNTRVYLDAGNPGWQSAEAMAPRLLQSGVGLADGFALNVSNFRTTQDNLSYGSQLSQLLGGKHFVIDTSRNGRGPYAAGPNPWCNPPDRALGPAPTSATDTRGVDAYLWVKQPGDSDGSCRPGAPAAGTWWPEYALEVARNSP